jgi:uncharacterized alkaline shock family protein YloU
VERGAHVVAETGAGTVAITSDAIAQIVGNVVAESYGVVRRVGRRKPLRLFQRNRAERGVVVRRREDGLALEVHVVVEYGLNLAEVAAAVRSRVAYEVHRATRLEVAVVDVHVEDARRSS